MFNNPDVTPAEGMEFKWEKPDEDALKKFLVEDKQFSENRIDNGIERLKKSLGKQNQSRLDSFFMKAPSSSTSKVEPKKGQMGKKQSTTGQNKRGTSAKKGK